VLGVRRKETIKISSNPLRFTIYGLTVFMTREEELRKQGWEKRFTIDEPRLSEMVEQYKELGFEVLLEPVDTSSEECTTCITAFHDRYKTIYTRQRS
jgi:predicted ATPase